MDSWIDVSLSCFPPPIRVTCFILEEIVSEATFNNFNDVEPFLLCSTVALPNLALKEEKDCDGTVASLNNRNSNEIMGALSSQKLPSENISDDVSALTAISNVREDSDEGDPHIPGVQGVLSDGGVVVEGPLLPTTTRLFPAANSGSDQAADYNSSWELYPRALHYRS